MRITPSWLAPLALCIASWLAGCADDDGAPGTPAADASVAGEADACSLPQTWGPGLVKVTDAGQLAVNGQPFVARGVNSYPLLQLIGAQRPDAVDDIFAQAALLGRSLVRTPAFLELGQSPARLRDERGALREEGLRALDQVLDAAARSDTRLILILTNNWEDFGGAPALLNMVAPGENLPKNAFWTEPRVIRLQLDYQTALVQRVNSQNGRVYGQDPTIFAWELANEARCEREQTPALCDDGTLARWARRMSDGLRSAGAQQLIAWGGSGYLGEYGEDLRSIAAQGGVDILTLHMYETESARSADPVEAAIGAGERTLRERAAVAHQAGLPLLLEEVNWKPAASSERDAERATVLGAWLSVADDLGLGTLPWMLGEQGRPDYDGYLIRPDDGATTAVLRCE
ncbi:MAG: cellulose-binding, family [Myxococcaceae bacterium]|nr:cellulose-binding, family [Myxococcaceae bacterium]